MSYAMPGAKWRSRNSSLPAASRDRLGLHLARPEGCSQHLGRAPPLGNSSMPTIRLSDKRLTKELAEAEKRRKEQDELKESDFVAWSFVIYPDEGPSGDFLARATFVRRAPMFTARDWGTILLYVAIFFVTMFAMALMIGPVGSVAWGLFLFAALTRCHVWGWTHNFVYYLLLFIVLCIAWIWYSFVPHRSWKTWIWTAVVFSCIASLLFYFRAWVTLPRVQLPQRTMPVVYNFEEKDLRDFLKLKRRFGLLKNVFVGHHYVEGIASVLIPSVIFNSFAVRKALLVTCDFVLPFSFILAASHHTFGMAKALRNLVNEDWLVRCVRYIHHLLPWEAVSWNLFGFRWMVDEIGMHLQHFVWRIVIPFDAFLTTARARYNQFMGAVRPIGIMLQHVRVYSTTILHHGLQVVIWTKALMSFAVQSLHPVKVFLSIVFGVFHAAYYFIAVPVMLVFPLVQAMVTFILLPLRLLFGPLCDLFGPVFSDMGRRLALVGKSVSIVVQGPLAWWKNQLLFCTPKSGKSLSWWKYVTNSIGGICAIICGYCRAVVGAGPIEEDDLCDGLDSRDALHAKSTWLRQRKRHRRHSAPVLRPLRDDKRTPSCSSSDDGSYAQRTVESCVSYPERPNRNSDAEESVGYWGRRSTHYAVCREAMHAAERIVPNIGTDDGRRVRGRHRVYDARETCNEKMLHDVSMMENAGALVDQWNTQERAPETRRGDSPTVSLGLQTLTPGTLQSATRHGARDALESMNTKKRNSASEDVLCARCGVRGLAERGTRDTVSPPSSMAHTRELGAGPAVGERTRRRRPRREHDVRALEGTAGNQASHKSSSSDCDRRSGARREGNGVGVASVTTLFSEESQHTSVRTGRMAPERRGRTQNIVNATTSTGRESDREECVNGGIHRELPSPKKRRGKAKRECASGATLERAVLDKNPSPKKRNREKYVTHTPSLNHTLCAKGKIFGTQQSFATCFSDVPADDSVDMSKAQGKSADNSRGVGDKGSEKQPLAVRTREGLQDSEKQPPAVRTSECLEDGDRRLPAAQANEVLEDVAKGSSVDGPAQRKRRPRKRR